MLFLPFGAQTFCISTSTSSMALTCHARRIISQICWIYLTYTSGDEPIKNKKGGPVKKREGQMFIFYIYNHLHKHRIIFCTLCSTQKHTLHIFIRTEFLFKCVYCKFIFFIFQFLFQCIYLSTCFLTCLCIIAMHQMPSHIPCMCEHTWQ